MTYAGVLRPAFRPYALVYDMTWIIGGSLLIALAAQVAVPLPFTPVPVTGQTLAVVLMGALLGSARGGVCVIAYLAEGSMGLPVFTGGGAGIAHLMGPTGGYLLGFVAAAWLTGALAERGWDRRVKTALAAMFVGNAVIYVFGLPWLAYFVGGGRVLEMGLLPFVPGDLLKLGGAALLLPQGWRLMGKGGRGSRVEGPEQKR